ncbi:MAG: molecular chaperone HtpG [Spirochaetaceae bacterium]|nr:molecular chaperone HtpG [Spirochaetaceae bacterium]
MAKYEFETEVSKLLHLIIHSLYSNEEIFLRELISNASDALDKLQFLTVSNDAFKGIQFNPRIDISFDEEKKLLIIRDTGIGMDETDLQSNLGTIARSGTSSFLEKLEAEQKKASNLIGQFGVGFYSAFMVASKIEVISKKAGTDTVFRWTSDGTNAYEIEACSDADFPLLDGVPEGSCGSAIIIHLKDDKKEYASRWKIEELVKRYSDHVAFEIYLHYIQKKYDDKGKVESEQAACDKINDGTALWQRGKSELKEQDYIDFYKTFSHDNTDPLLYIHTKAEGTQEYTTLFFIPEKAPFDMYQANYKPGVKLFVKRVFITEDDKELLPVYLRFIRGIIDSEDLPLNVSREILQQNRILTAIKTASVNKILSELKKLAEKDTEKYTTFISQYNRLLKEGLYSDFEHRNELMELVRFKTTSEETTNGWIGLAQYISRMKAEQKAIYYLAGGTEETLRHSPHLQFYKSKGIEVLILDDDIDDIVMPMLGKYKDFEFKAINRISDDSELAPETEATKEQAEDFKPLLERLKTALGDAVKEVRISKTLAEAPACISYNEHDPDVQMQRMMKAMGQASPSKVAPILEINPNHSVLQKLKTEMNQELLADYGKVLLGQSQLAEGEEIANPAEFIKALNKLL